MATVTIMIAIGQKPWGHTARRLLGAEHDMCVVAEAPDAARALDAVRMHRPDVVLVDREIPPEGSLSLTRELVPVHPTAKILVVTKRPDDAFAVEVVRQGGHGVLATAALPASLPKAVRRLVGGELWLTRRQERLLSEALWRMTGRGSK